jgi:hypothetical protein
MRLISNITAVACPANTSGINVPSGCACNAGHAGSVSAVAISPFFSSTCTPAACPDYSTGISVVSGCICNAGYNGTVQAAFQAPFYLGGCFSVQCPVNSNGTNVGRGCICLPGFLGSVTAVMGAPFFTSTCSPQWITPSGSLATIYESQRIEYTVTVRVGVSGVVFSVVSGSLPAGASLNGVTGVISGMAAVASDTTSSFTVRATLGSSYADRAFSITVLALIVNQFTFSGSNVNFIVPATLTSINVYMWAAAGGGATGEGYNDPGLCLPLDVYR